MKKQFLRVKQIADQTFLRAEKTEVLTEDLVNAEKRVDMIKLSCQALSKKIASCHIDLGSEISSEKRLKKIPQVVLASSMQDNGCAFSKDSILGTILRECAPIQAKLGTELLEYYSEVEKSILKQINNILENEVHTINKLRKQLGKLTLDMDSARTRYQTAERHNSQAGVNTGAVNAAAKVDVLKDELEEASQKVDQCRDALAAEMFSLIAKEPQISHLFVHFHNIQANYHRNALSALESSLPVLEDCVSDFSQKPVYGCSLEEHLRVTSRTIALVIEMCISFLLECGVTEEGLFRIAGSASKLKKLKSAFDSGMEFDMTEYIRDPHAVSGALKSYLRELPEPLMTFSLYNEWMNAAKMQDFDARLQALWQVVHKLPASNFSNLQYVIKFLSKLQEFSEVNKMSAQNIAIVMAPNLIWAPMEEANPTFGMNMATANLHSSIVETLISYADWFFPDSGFSFKLGMSSSMPTISLSGPQNSVSSDEPENEEISNTNLLDDASHIVNMQSPKVFPRAVKKPAAPPPPAQRVPNKEKNCNDTLSVTTDLMDLTSDSESIADTEDVVLRSSKYSTLPHNSNSKEKPEKNARGSVIRRRSNENMTNLERIPSVRQEKPSIPDKPVSYSVHSLDRKSRPPSVSGILPKAAGSTDKLSEVTLRSQIERPTVPPPERPAKPSRFSTMETFQPEKIKVPEKPEVNEEQCSSREIINIVKTPEVKPRSEVNAVCDSDNSNNAIKSGHSPTQPQTKPRQNRFDFLVSQTSEKPPERPPRSASSSQDLSELLNIVHDSSKGKDAEGQLINLSPSVTSPGGAVSDNIQTPVIVPRSSLTETDKIRPPPRPQPPVPLSKPRINSSIENTNL